MKIPGNRTHTVLDTNCFELELIYHHRNIILELELQGVV